jgi:adenine phosphoribosyltransferase
LKSLQAMNQEEAISYLKGITRSIENYPKKGIVFRDLTTIFQDAKALSLSLDLMTGFLKDENSNMLKFDKLAGIEARGFLLAGAISGRIGGGVIMMRKPGKLPYKKRRIEYQLEYGEDALEVHEDAIKQGEKVVLIDDLLATGGTAEAGCRLVEELGGVVIKVLFLVELPELEGRKRLSRYDVASVFSFEGK